MTGPGKETKDCTELFNLWLKTTHQTVADHRPQFVFNWQCLRIVIPRWSFALRSFLQAPRRYNSSSVVSRELCKCIVKLFLSPVQLPACGTDFRLRR